MQIKLERIYTKPIDETGYRVLVDRLWPRGISKVNAKLAWWAKEIGPSTELRKWFGHDSEKFTEFAEKYRLELNQADFTTEFLEKIQTEVRTQDVIFLYGAKDETHNQAVILKQYVEAYLKK
ncbi:DUF488 family protein [Pediococcus ethanolidurans]|uniref:DUF488 domain-containing protein n=1 Tax=Pediococcus ethanolidurans TaxID=319653 RepID=UPI001C1EFD01|nr:DUF488 family protein [Pediococcus ethanolidurans]MBU7555489.1 DUF488 family protein [Pediococcus ethanolidurans]MBU7564229.1 DUF488 family protein [Pediococcus ethanolidurans]MCT4398459.1 DUF488 family protein [Pediococcus ethanolidurans]MCV3315882.1 DUF488 family protein [Pediococcus ethanolidurans]MCV3321917.1 DUF488 family protein [Pediococcus ethanolidurans]